MSLFPETPLTLLDELARNQELDEAKWRQFDALYRPVVTTFLRTRFPVLSSEVDDVAQDVMIRLVTVLREQNYDASRGRFRTFLGMIIHNLAVDLLRRRTRYAALPFEMIDWTSPAFSKNGGGDLLDRQWRESCYSAARRHVLHQVPLPPHYADVWRALEKGESVADLVVRLGVSAAFVRQAKHRVAVLIAAAVRNLDD